MGQVEFAFARRGVVALEAVVGDDGGNFAIEELGADVLLGDGRCGGRVGAGFKVGQDFVLRKTAIVDGDEEVSAQPGPVAAVFVRQCERVRVVPIVRATGDVLLGDLFAVEVDGGAATAVVGVDDVAWVGF